MPTTEAAIFARLWDRSPGGLTPTVARHVLRLGFESDDLRQMHVLLERNRTGALTAAEREELDGYVKVADLLAILQSKARKVLGVPPADRDGHG